MTLPRSGRLLLFSDSPRGKLLLLGFPVIFLAAQELGVVLTLQRRRRQRSVEPVEPDVEASGELVAAADGIESRLARSREEADGLRDQMNRMEEMLRAQAFRLALVEAAVREQPADRSAHGKVSVSTSTEAADSSSEVLVVVPG
jgi:hypothetical protein